MKTINSVPFEYDELGNKKIIVPPQREENWE